MSPGVGVEDEDTDPDEDSGSGAVLQRTDPDPDPGIDPGSLTHIQTSWSCVDVRLPVCAGEASSQVSSRQVEALFHYSVTGDSAYLLAPQRPLMTAQDEDGDTSVTV